MDTTDNINRTVTSATGIYVTDITEAFPEGGGPSSNVNLALAAGLGLTALLVVLLLIALALVLYQKRMERIDAERDERESPPPVPIRPDDDIDSNSNSPGLNPRRDPSGLSYNYVRPEAVRISAVQHGVGMSPKTKSRRKDGGEEYYSVVQESSPRLSYLNEQRRKSDTENNYYIQVVENDGVGAQRTPKENPYYMQVEEGADESDYVIDAIDRKSDSNIKSPKRQDSENEYYSKVYTMNKTADASNISDGRHDDISDADEDQYSFPPDTKIENPSTIKAQESHKYSNIQVMKNNNKASDSKEVSKHNGEKQSDTSKEKKNKSVIYMNIRKLKK
ncbi:uncharacterized protein [Amphiura filiformis]